MLSPKYSEEKSILSSAGTGVYYRLFIDNHIDTRREIKNYVESVFNFKKIDISFVYNFYISRYENYIYENPFLSEENLISFYDILQQNKIDGGFKKINIQKMFDEDMDSGILATNNNLRYFFDSPEDKNDSDKFVLSSKEVSAFKRFLPSYTHVSFDNIRGNYGDLGKLLDKYGLRKKIITKFIDSKQSLFKLSNSVFINDLLVKDVAFFSNLEILRSFNVVDQNIIKSNTETKYDVIGYKISKFYGKTGFSEPVQEWIISASSEEVSTLLDTQIKYNKKYCYKVSCIVATFGAEYSLTSDEQITNIKNDIYIFEVKTAEYEGKLLSNPPTPPEISFIPSINEPTKIKIFLNNSSDKILTKPVILIPREDNEFLNDIKNTDIMENDKVWYNTNTRISGYQIFKLDREPKSIIDFANGTIIKTDIGISCFEDQISVNKKYYYIVRCIDIHDNTSNPTEIYTVETIDEGGAVYSIIGMYDMEKRETIKQVNKSFKKYFSFTPQLNQVFPTEQTEELRGISKEKALDMVQVGTPGETLWGKKFKIRLTSNSTGRKIDFNVEYKKELLKTK